MNFQEIHSTLDSRLQTVTGLPNFTSENRIYEPKTGVPYSRSTLSPATTNRLTNATDLLNGLYLIDLFYPINRGTGDVAAMTETVLASFRRGVAITEDNSTLHIDGSWREVAQILDQFYQVQVVVRWGSEQPR